jgi:hypothetical protein
MSSVNPRKRRRLSRRDHDRRRLQVKVCATVAQTTASSDIHRRCLVFPDVLLEKDLLSDDQSVSETFFDLANAAEVAYKDLVFHQDISACGQHTGGIIWETSYLLLQFLTAQNCRLGTTVGLGAGVGFLGQCLARHGLCESMAVTETNSVMQNLERNVDRNKELLKGQNLLAFPLDWNTFDADVAAADWEPPHSADTIISTDVIFAVDLVEPLLKTAAYLSHQNTVWYLCVQIRCATAHTAFKEKAPVHGFLIQDISQEAFGFTNCAWGRLMDCLLFRITQNHS